MTREKLAKQQIKQKIEEERWIKAEVLFQLIGNPKEHVEQTLKAYIDNIATMESVILLEEDYAPAEDLGGDQKGIFSTYCEAKLLVENLETLTFFCINYMPANIEIKEPGQMMVKDKQLTDWFNDLLAKLHEVSVVAKQVRNQNDHLVRGFNALVKNYVTHLIKEGVDTIKGLSEKTGIDEKSLEQFLGALAKEGGISIEVDKVALAKDIKKAKKKATKKKKK
ncbi:MAG: hypothetical protein ABIA93_01240 [Candidatus Woesearchaeota archaeon]